MSILLDLRLVGMFYFNILIGLFLLSKFINKSLYGAYIMLATSIICFSISLIERKIEKEFELEIKINYLKHIPHHWGYKHIISK